MSFWIKLLFSASLLIAGSCGNEIGKNEVETCEGKIYNSLPTINDTIGFSRLSNTADTSIFSVFSKFGTESISLFYKQDSICFRFQNETIAVPVSPEHQYHKLKSNPIFF